MKRAIFTLLCCALAGCAPNNGPKADREAREVMDGPYTLAYRVFQGDYKDNGPVFTRVAADLAAAGITTTRSLAIFLKDPRTTSPRDLLCVCGAVIEEKDWPRIEGLPPSLRIMHIPRAARIVCRYPVTGPESYAEGGSLCYPLLESFAARHGRTAVGSFEVYDAGARMISYVGRTAEKEADYPAAKSPARGEPAAAVWPMPEWETSSPEAQGMDSLKLAAALERVPSMWDLHEIDNLLVTRHGRIVLEVSFHPNTRALRHELHSVTKSVTSTLIGMAAERGLLRLEDPALSFFPGRTVANMSPEKAAITVRDLLSMRSGIEFQEFPLTGSDNTHARLLGSPDWTAFSLDLPMAARPGARFNYSDGDMAILSGILGAASWGGMRGLADELFASLGITNHEWRTDPKGNPMPNDGLFLTPRDMARIGYLYLREGMWNGKRILPEEWVRDIRSASAEATGWATPRYGMLWWVDRTGSVYAANGSAGQMIIVMPDQDIVAVVTAKQGAAEEAPGFLEVAHELILPAVKRDGALPENPQGLARLQDRIRRFESPAPRPVPALPAEAARISGRTILLAPNQVGVTSVTLRFADGEASAVIRRNGSTATLPIGLDGLQRISAPMGSEMLSSLGYWDDGETFFIESRVLQGDFLYRMGFHFSGDEVQVTLTVADELWQSVSMAGRLSE